MNMAANGFNVTCKTIKYIMSLQVCQIEVSVDYIKSVCAQLKMNKKYLSSSSPVLLLLFWQTEGRCHKILGYTLTVVQ